MSLTLALILDAIFGEPDWLWRRLPHPAVLMGRAVSFLDEALNRGARRKIAGIVALAILVLLASGVGLALAALPGKGAEVIVGAILIAQRSLVSHVAAVAVALGDGPAAGRRAVAMIVGRDTALMDTPAIARAAIESAAENFSDGVVSPAFWFLMAGLPGLVCYKMVNTADSMIGHRSKRYLEFGWAAARLDDVLNWVPARLATLLIALATPKRGAWAVIRRDAPLHRSPNAGWPEAAMAAGLEVALSGPRSYDGTRRDDPFVNPDGRHDIGANEVRACIRALWKAWALFLALAVMLWLVW